MLGAHVSVAGGLDLACERARRLGCEAIQVFTRNQRQWRAPPLTDAQCRAFRAALARGPALVAFAHGSYLVNLASAERRGFERSIGAVVDELERCERLGLSFLVMHPGSSGDLGPREGVRRMARGIDEALRATRGARVELVLETAAGQGSSVGRTFEELEAVLAAVREPERVGVCVDTCHVFAAGYDIRTRTGWEETVARLDATVGLAKLRAFHVNDSKRELGSRVDRHESIGRGKLGLEAFRHLMTEPRFAGVPKVIETPKGVSGHDGGALDPVNLGRLRRLAASRRPGGARSRARACGAPRPRRA